MQQQKHKETIEKALSALPWTVVLAAAEANASAVAVPIAIAAAVAAAVASPPFFTCKCT